MKITKIYTWEPSDIKRNLKIIYNHSKGSTPAAIVQIADVNHIREGKMYLVVDSSGWASGPGTAAEVAALLTTNNSTPEEDQSCPPILG